VGLSPAISFLNWIHYTKILSRIFKKIPLQNSAGLLGLVKDPETDYWF